EFLEVGLASGEEGIHALEAFLRAPDVGEQLHAVLPRRIKKIGLEVQALLGHAQRLRAMALDGLAPRQCLLAQVRLRHAFVDEADLDGLFRGEAPSAEDHLARQPFADDARQILRRPHGRAGADPRPGLAEHGILRGNDQIAPQGELVAAAHAPAVDHGNDGNRQAANGHGETLHAVVPHGAVHPGQALHGVEVAACGKRLVAGAGHDRARDRGILARGFQRIDELIEGLLAKGVEHAPPVDGRPRDVIFDLIENIAVAPLVGAALLRCGLFCHVLSPIPWFHSGRAFEPSPELEDRPPRRASCAVAAVIGAARWCEQVGTSADKKETGTHAGIDRTRRQSRSSSQAARRNDRRGGILDRRPDRGGAAGLTWRVRLLSGRRRRLYPGRAAGAADLPDLSTLGMRASTQPYALLLAQTARQRFSAARAVAESGATGPAGNRYGDPAGHSCIAVAGSTERAITLETGSGDRLGNMHAFTAAALELLLDVLAAEAGTRA